MESIKSHVMFDVDGTLIESYQHYEVCFLAAVKEVTGIDLHNNWNTYPFVTDKGILLTFIERQAPQFTLQQLEQQVKPIFINNLKQCISQYPVKEVAGAKAFLKNLLHSGEFQISFATDCWKEATLLSLQSAGFNVDNFTMTSSDDHYARTEIMRIAKERAGDVDDFQLTYFGDSESDMRASDALKMNLVIVGNKIHHYQSINDFQDIPHVLEFVLEH